MPLLASLEIPCGTCSGVTVGARSNFGELFGSRNLGFETRKVRLKYCVSKLSGFRFWVSNPWVLGLEPLLLRPLGIESNGLRPWPRTPGSRNPKSQTPYFVLLGPQPNYQKLCIQTLALAQKPLAPSPASSRDPVWDLQWCDCWHALEFWGAFWVSKSWIRDPQGASQILRFETFGFWIFGSRIFGFWISNLCF